MNEAFEYGIAQLNTVTMGTKTATMLDMTQETVELVDFLSEAGKRGWELCTGIRTGVYQEELVFKRQVKNSSIKI